MELLEQLEKDPEMSVDKLKPLLEEAIKINAEVTRTLIGKGKLNDIYQNLLDNKVPGEGKKPKI